MRNVSNGPDYWWKTSVGFHSIKVLISGVVGSRKQLLFVDRWGERNWYRKVEIGFYKHCKSLNGWKNEACEEITRLDLLNMHILLPFKILEFLELIFFDNNTIEKFIELVY